MPMLCGGQNKWRRIVTACYTALVEEFLPAMLNLLTRGRRHHSARWIGSGHRLGSGQAG
jgi:hypothetical protein